MFGVAPALAELMLEAWPTWASDVDLLCPVPLHHERERERGYNQSTLLVQSLQQQVEIESDFNALQRIRHTRPQIDLDRTERQDNVKGAFKAVRERVAGRRILLVDDVCTTGATLTAAATALLESGATTVSGYCLARPLVE
jgi:ComF family protein